MSVFHSIGLLIRAFFRDRAELVVENLALRQQLEEREQPRACRECPVPLDWVRTGHLFPQGMETAISYSNFGPENAILRFFHQLVRLLLEQESPTSKTSDNYLPVWACSYAFNSGGCVEHPPLNPKRPDDGDGQ